MASPLDAILKRHQRGGDPTGQNRTFPDANTRKVSRKVSGKVSGNPPETSPAPTNQPGRLAGNDDPRPCPECGSPIWWRSTAGGLHCAVCMDPPSKHLVADVLTVATEPDGSWSWELHRPGQPKPKPGDLLQTRNGWTRRENDNWTIFEKTNP